MAKMHLTNGCKLLILLSNNRVGLDKKLVWIRWV